MVSKPIAAPNSLPAQEQADMGKNEATQVLRSKDFFEQNRMPLCVFRMPFRQEDRLRHSHEFYEIMIVIGGFANHCIGKSKETISMGDVFIIPPGVSHSYAVGERGGVQVLNVLFGEELLEGNLRDLQASIGYRQLRGLTPHPTTSYVHLKLTARDLARTNSIVEQIEIEQEDLAAGWELLCESKFRELLIILVRALSHVQGRIDKNVQKLSEVLAFMEQNLSSNLDFPALAEVSRMPATSLRRAFQDAFGCSPMSYVKHLRIRKAMLLLNDPVKTVTDVAFEVGFTDSGHFARVFKLETSQTPSEFRKTLS